MLLILKKPVKRKVLDSCSILPLSRFIGYLSVRRPLSASNVFSDFPLLRLVEAFV